ncbi:DUF4233 domain-containing protein [Demequina sp. SO4-18]|uniref:DUF4233 domain-containing protein n=1 Tax=Demequina sp. SO4-18 TaxID=3401026 RepID=UPI003B5BA156
MTPEETPRDAARERAQDDAAQDDATQDDAQERTPASASDTAPAQPDAAQPRPQRPATLVFTQSVLALQAFVALFATLVAWSFAHNGLLDVPAGWVAGVGIALMVLLFYAAGKQKKRWGRILGWVLQAPMLVAGVLVPAIAALGLVFLVIWVMALRLGSRIDRERKERDEAAAAATDRDGAPDASDGASSSPAPADGPTSNGQASA